MKTWAFLLSLALVSSPSFAQQKEKDKKDTKKQPEKAPATLGPEELIKEAETKAAAGDAGFLATFHVGNISGTTGRFNRRGRVAVDTFHTVRGGRCVLRCAGRRRRIDKVGQGIDNVARVLKPQVMARLALGAAAFSSGCALGLERVERGLVVAILAVALVFGLGIVHRPFGMLRRPLGGVFAAKRQPIVAGEVGRHGGGRKREG